MTLWSGRFEGTPDPAAFDFGVSFGFDRALFEDDVTGSIAWAEALGAAGVVSDEDTRAMVSGLEAILEEGRRDPSYVSGPTKLHSLSKASDRTTGDPAGGSIGRARKTSRSHWTCACTSGGAFPSCRPEGRAGSRVRTQAAGAGGALIAFTYTNLCRAHGLVAHYFLSTRPRCTSRHARWRTSEEADP